MCVFSILGHIIFPHLDRASLGGLQEATTLIDSKNGSCVRSSPTWELISSWKRGILCVRWMCYGGALHLSFLYWGCLERLFLFQMCQVTWALLSLCVTLGLSLCPCHPLSLKRRHSSREIMTSYSLSTLGLFSIRALEKTCVIFTITIVVEKRKYLVFHSTCICPSYNNFIMHSFSVYLPEIILAADCAHWI